MSVVCVAKYHYWEEAIIAKSKLEFYGIPAFFPEEHFARFKIFTVQGATGCHIEVPKSFEDDARFLLARDPPTEIKVDPPPITSTLSPNLIAWGFLLIHETSFFSLLFLADMIYHWIKGTLYKKFA